METLPGVYPAVAILLQGLTEEAAESSDGCGSMHCKRPLREYDAVI
jgi:hypothetical protein